MKILAKISFFFAVFIPALASAQFPVYQPGANPTPALQTTPFNAIAKGFASDEYLRLSMAPGVSGPLADYIVTGTLDMTSTSSVVNIRVSGYASVALKFTRTAQTGSIILQGSYDNSNWDNLVMYQPLSGPPDMTYGTSGINVTFSGLEPVAPVLGYTYARVKVSGAGTGSLPVILIAKSEALPVVKDVIPGIGAKNLGKAEDGTPANGDTLVGLAVKIQSALSADATANNYGTLKGDTLGRLLIGQAPAADLIYGCNTAVTTATTGSMIAANASNRYYAMSWNCTNTGGAASRVILEDGDGNDLANTFLPATSGAASLTFGSPIAASAVNKALQINVITTGTSTICCVNGFRAVN